MITELLADLNLSFSPDPAKLPAPLDTLELGSGITLPLYKSPIGGEIDLYQQITRKIAPSLVKLSNLSSALGTKVSSFSDLVMQLQIGQVLIDLKEEIELDDELTGKPVLADIAKRAGVTVFSNVYPYIDETRSDELVDAINKYVQVWLNNNIPGETGLEKANYILSGKPAYRITGQKVKVIDGQQLLDDCHLTWNDLYTLDAIDKPEFKALLCVYFRTGISGFNPFSYMTPKTYSLNLSILQSETEIAPQGQEEVIKNENVETQTSEGGTDPLDSDELTSSPPATKRTTTKKTDS